MKIRFYPLYGVFRMEDLIFNLQNGQSQNYENGTWCIFSKPTALRSQKKSVRSERHIYVRTVVSVRQH